MSRAAAFYQQILHADHGYDLNTIADHITTANLNPADLERLQVAYARRCRELWPNQCGATAKAHR